MSTIYVIDSNALIDLNWRRYPEDLFGSLHRLVDELVTAHRLVSTEEVYRELEKQDDEAHAWCKKRRDIFAPSADEALQRRLIAVLERTPTIVDPRRPHKNAADPWLVALALHVRGAVVTEETSNPGARVARLPDVCAMERVPCIGLLDLMRRERWSF